MLSIKDIVLSAINIHDSDADSGYSDSVRADSPLSELVTAHSELLPTKKELRRLIKWSLPPPSTPSVLMPGWQPMLFGMEQFWQSAFACFFHYFLKSDGHIWTLTPTDVPPAPSQWNWHSTHYTTKVRFLCPLNHGWTSMKGRVAFWYRLRRQGEEIIAEVHFKLYGQKCERCSNCHDSFVSPLWYYEEIENAMRFLSTQVCQTYYGGHKAGAPQPVRLGRTKGFHNASQCQACFDGFCTL